MSLGERREKANASLASARRIVRGGEICGRIIWKNRHRDPNGFCLRRIHQRSGRKKRLISQSMSRVVAKYPGFGNWSTARGYGAHLSGHAKEVATVRLICSQRDATAIVGSLSKWRFECLMTMHGAPFRNTESRLKKIMSCICDQVWYKVHGWTFPEKDGTCFGRS